jgi:predicted phosphodiesterase
MGSTTRFYKRKTEEGINEMGSYTFKKGSIDRGDFSGQTEVFMSDIHFQSEHPAPHCWEIALQIVRYVKPQLITLGGDIVEHGPVSRHPKALVDKTRFKADRDATRRELGRLRKAARGSLIVAKEGNHDQMIQEFINKNAGELGDLEELQFPALYHLDRHSIEWVPAGYKERVGKLYRIHGHELGLNGPKACENAFKSMGVSVIFGHTHRVGSYYKRDYKGNLRGAWNNPCLYTFDPDYCHHTEWAQGLSVIKYVRGGFFSVDQVLIHEQDGVAFAVYNGRTFESEVS